MADFQENELREEEDGGKFTPGTPDDETFHLENLDAYPGDLPDYSDLEEEEKVSLEEQLDLVDEKSEEEEIADSVAIVIPDGEEAEEENIIATPAIIDESDPEPQVNETVEEEPAMILDESVIDDDTEVDNLEIAIKDEPVEEDAEEAGSVWDLFDEDGSETEKSNEIEEPETIGEGEEPQISAEEDDEEVIGEAGEELLVDDESGQEEDIEIDEDFKQMIQDDLDKSKTKKEAPKENTDSALTEDEDFTAVEDEEDVNEIDLSRLDALHPSSFNTDNTEKAEKAEKKKSKRVRQVVTDPEPEISEDTDEMPDEDDGMDFIFHEEAEKVEEEAKEKKAPKEKKDRKKIIFFVAAAMVIIAFGAMTYDWGWNRGAFADIFGFGPHPDTLAVVHDQPETHKPEKKDEEHKDTNIVEHNTEPQIVEDEHPTVEESPKEEVVIEKKKAAPITEVRVVQPKPHSKYKPVKKKTEQEAYKLTPSTNKNDRVFTVQVYASPSKEDAESWVRKLKAKNVSNVFISEQKKRDREWYRVRFGSYESADEARKAAIQLGFAQSWIDRVK